eukprot:13019719-Ditylum_brightwellii.AAC.1
MKVKKDDTKAADFCVVVAATKRDIESGKHRQYKLDPNKFICETRDGMDDISIFIKDEESSDEESSGCKSFSASPPFSGLLSSGLPSSSVSSDVSTASSSLH